MHLASTFFLLIVSYVIGSVSNPTFSVNIERHSTTGVISSTGIPEDRVYGTTPVPGFSATAAPTFADPSNAIQIRIPGSDIGLNIYLTPNTIDPAVFQPLFSEADRRIAEEVSQHGREAVVPSPFRQRNAVLGLQINLMWRFQWFDMMDVMRGLHILISTHHLDKLFHFDIFYRLNHVGEGYVISFSTTQLAGVSNGSMTSSRDPTFEAA